MPIIYYSSDFTTNYQFPTGAKFTKCLSVYMQKGVK